MQWHVYEFTWLGGENWNRDKYQSTRQPRLICFPIRPYLRNSNASFPFSPLFLPQFLPVASRVANSQCQETGDVLRNQFFPCSLCHPSSPSPPLLASAVSENSSRRCLRNFAYQGDTRESVSRVHCQAPWYLSSFLLAHFPEDLYPWLYGRLLFWIPWYTSLTYAGCATCSNRLTERHFQLPLSDTRNRCTEPAILLSPFPLRFHSLRLVVLLPPGDDAVSQKQDSRDN